MRQKRLYRLALAGLLHDIGKIGQPAQVAISSDIERIAEHFCPPTPDGKRSHRHVLFTAQAIRDAKNDFGTLATDESFLRLAAAHHNPDANDFDQCVLQKADWLASGHDRKPDQFENNEPIYGLRPSLSVIQIDEAVVDPQRSIPTERLMFTASKSLPIPTPSKVEYETSCKELWTVLNDNLKQVYSDPADCVEAIYYLLADVGGNVPSSRSRGQSPDINLFDHSRLVAAFATCLAYLHPNGPADANQIHGSYRFLGVSLGGIQNYLFHEPPPLDAAPGFTGQKGIAKTLRARSFLVGLLGWLLPHKILDSIDFPVVNSVFEAGGRSLLLLPDDENLIKQINEVLTWVHRDIDELSRGGLRFDFAWSDRLLDSAFSGKCFKETYGTFMRKVTSSRYRVPSFLLESEKWGNDAWVVPELKDDKLDQHLIRLGQVLPKVRYLTLNAEHVPGESFSMELLGYKVTLSTSRPSRGRSFELLPSSEAERSPSRFLLLANHVPIATEEDCAKVGAEDVVSHDGHLTTHATDDDNQLSPGGIIPFENLAFMSESDSGAPFTHPMLGVLKADIDDLGQLLTKGLGDQASLGRFAGVSRSLDQFFKGFLTQLLRDRFSNIYTVYAGGDDLFLIGPWFDIVRFSVEIHDQFEGMKCNNPNLTFSAGLVFCKPTTPVRQMARFADQALDLSKDLGKNRISLGSLTMEWNTFRSGVKRSALLGQLMISQRKSGDSGIVSGLVYRLLQYSKMALRCVASQKSYSFKRCEPSTSDWKWRSQLNYDLKRNLDDKIENKAIDELRAWLLSITSESTHEVAALYTAATLALYQQRGE